MQALFLKGTENTPQFNYDVENFTISLIGNSKIDQSTPFYQYITEFIATVELAKPIRLNIEINLDSICRTSKRGLLFFLMRLKELQVHCKTDIRINWHYESGNDLTRVIGEDLEYMVMIPMQTKVIKNKQVKSPELAESF